MRIGTCIACLFLVLSRGLGAQIPKTEAPADIQRMIGASSTDGLTIPPLPPEPRISLADVRSTSPSRSFLGWEPGTKHSDQFIKDGAQVLTINNDGLVVSASIWKVARSLRVDLQIKNNTKARVDFYPGAVTVIEFKKTYKNIVQLDPDGLARAQTIGATIGAITAGAFGDASYDKTSEYLKAQGAAEWIRGTAFRANTLMPGETKSGALWFKNGGADLHLDVVVNGLTFEYPFHFK